MGGYKSFSELPELEDSYLYLCVPSCANNSSYIPNKKYSEYHVTSVS